MASCGTPTRLATTAEPASPVPPVPPPTTAKHTSTHFVAGLCCGHLVPQPAQISQVGAFSDCFGGHKNLWESLVASAATHGPLQCAGVRKILEVVPEGGFEKLRMAPNYEWMTYSEYFKTADSLGAGLAEAIPGLKANDTVVIYADTQRDWMLAAYACWRQGCVVGTIYATLGAEGAEYGINQSGCKAHAPPALHLALRAALTALAAPRRRRLTRRSPLPITITSLHTADRCPPTTRLADAALCRRSSQTPSCSRSWR